VSETLGVGVERAFEGPMNRCTLVPSAGPDGWALAVRSGDVSDRAAKMQAHLAWSLGAAPEPSVVDLDVPSGELTIREIALHGNTILLEPSFGSRVISPKLFGIPERSLLPLGPLPGGFHPILAGDTLYFQSDESFARLLAVRVPDPVMSVIAKPAEPFELSAIAVDRRRSEIVWLESPRGDGTSVVWKASLPIGEGASAKRVVARVDHAAQGSVVADGGTIVLTTTDGRGVLVDSETGTVTPVPAEPDAPLLRPLWINERSVWFVVTVMYRNGQFSAAQGVVEIARSNLAIR